MRDASGRSSAVGSAHSSPREGTEETPTLEREQPGDVASSATELAPATLESSKPSNANELETRAPESQPMTKSDSSSSNPPGKDASNSSAGVPYGTRSRNRTGNSRPNYAEDKEIDIELEVVAPPFQSSARKAKAAEPAPMVMDSGRPISTSRKGPGGEAEQSVLMQNHYREPIPGTSTFSANPAAAPNSHNGSKKRKAANQTPASHQSQMSIPNLGPHSTTRGASIAAQGNGTVQDSNMLTFEACQGRPTGKTLHADDGTILEVNDHVYLVCEPPGEPYYLGRIMEFLHINNNPTQPIDALRLNWYYRPKDIGRKVNDTRQVFASMHSDISPLTALRGKCQIKHKSEVDKLDELRKTKDCFWYEKLYDRYIHRFYDVIPTSQVINVPIEVKKVLDERWRYIIVEPGRGKELTSAVKSCKRCNKYCASNDSVDCAVCHNTYHMSCVNPPLLKKPSRGFAWACGPCSKAQEKRLEARNTPNVADPTGDIDEDEYNEEEDGQSGAIDSALQTGRTSPTVSSEAEGALHSGTPEQIHQASLWLFRYLGIHCRVEDALDYDDRIYPRASSRLGPRHQAVVPAWPGRPVEYVKPAEIKRKYVKGGGHKKDTKLSKDTVAALEADKLAREQRPKWVMDEPPGYVHRGEDYEDGDPNSTSELLYKFPEANEIPPRDIDGDGPQPLDEKAREGHIFNYMAYVGGNMPRALGLPALSTNLLDVALETLHANKYDVDKAIESLSKSDKAVFKEPALSTTELKKFEDGVAKFGSEWHSIKKHVKTVKAADIVRFYYTWKKSESGKRVWGNYSGRKGKKEAKRAEATTGKLQDDVADEHDDSAFDNEKAETKKRRFQCKFCGTKESRQWRRAPNTPAGTMISENPGVKVTGKDKSTQLMVALCRRCAELWRRYAIQWEDIDQVAKQVAQAGGRAWKRKIDEELLKELVAANEVVNQAISLPSAAPNSANGTPAPQANLGQITEPPRKKLKGPSERESTDPGIDSSVSSISGPKKKTAPEKQAAPPPPPEPPKPKQMPCAICGELEPMGDQHLCCKDCRLTVHRNCYGVVGEHRSPSKWTCDMCSNDKNPQVSIQYECKLCPIKFTEQDFVEPPKVSHKKKTEKDRERDRVERENAQKVADYFRKKQEEMNKPVNPREPLKRTANNNWIHVTCAVFTPEVKFGNGKALEPSEGLGSIPTARWQDTCKVCKKQDGACVSCHTCRIPVHVECAHQAGYILGFDIAPVKGSRRDQFNIVTIAGEVGTMTAAIWCKEHVPTKTIVHRMHDIVDEESGLNALQLYVQNFKQADLALTGTVRKATLVSQSAKVVNPASVAPPPNRRASTNTGGSHNGRGSLSHAKPDDSPGETSTTVQSDSRRICITCNVDISPKWWPFPPTPTDKPPATSLDPASLDNSQHHMNGHLTNGHATLDSEEETNGAHIALAAAALHQNPSKSISVPNEFQCQQCHFKKKRKEVSPPPPLPPREPSRPLIPTPQPAPAVLPREADNIAPPQHTSPYWSNPPAPPPLAAYATNGSSNGPPNGPPYRWSRPSPAPQSIPHVNQLNGNHSPRINSGSVQALGGQPPIRHQSHGIPHSPHQNGHHPQIPNSYPSSPRHAIGSPPLHMQNGSYPSYASTRPAPQHLTNGGPPPRAPEHPFSQNSAPMHSRGSFGPPQGSPPMLRESHPQGRDLTNSQATNSRPNDGRVNGGASASPSLRNLLS
ncbi:uncharacterized protein LY89DRAFT_574599 [Mollisia scopiformis]|uniref:Uncharacterized protein n=1 Tax=Mollisia scopiformis TaxID=149040 RepID=A0A194XR87_MOLSC|nr:uncharacterized protein LY89DRAFT_574599 [Mollisia scopiformis]KUJ22242.1 hypothetical protein LY89DRAFT_574599 [Mollisia scopiformis]